VAAGEKGGKRHEMPCHHNLGKLPVSPSTAAEQLPILVQVFRTIIGRTTAVNTTLPFSG